MVKFHHQYMEQCWATGHVALKAILGTTKQVPSQLVKSQKLIWRSGTRRCNLRVPDLHMSFSDLIKGRGYQDGSPSNVSQGDMPFSVQSAKA